MEDSKNRLLILGFDGASPALLEKWMGEGKLPTLKKLIAEGAYGWLRSVPNIYSPAAWTTFATGKNPGKHGIYHFTQRDFSTYNFKHVNASYRRAETFWEKLCGTRVGCIMNIPMTFPVDKINGCMISGFDAPSTKSKGVCYPEELIEEMNAANGAYRIIPGFAQYLRRGGDWRAAADRLLDNMEMRYRHVTYLMDKYDWDLFTVVFGETDLSQHFFWKFIDPDHPDYDAAIADQFGDTILRVYQRMDDIVARFIDKYPGDNLMIVSDHGGAVNSRGEQALAGWLEHMGLLHKEPVTWGEPLKKARRGLKSATGWGYQLAQRVIPPELKAKLAHALPGLMEFVEEAVYLGNFDWKTTKAFCNGTQDDIWINLVGRDPEGVVRPEEYDDLCDYICDELRAAVDLTSGKPIVDAVFRKAEEYFGDFVDMAPDISIRWKEDIVVTGIKTKNTPAGQAPIKWQWPPETSTGKHALYGILIASGPAIAQGVAIDNAGLADIAPTIFYIFDEEIPADLDGRPLVEMFDDSTSKRIRYAEKSDGATETKKDAYSDDDTAIIEQRLKDLGYM